MYTPPGFDEDTHAARYGFTLSHGDALPNDERTRCIEHNAYDCAECDADWIDLGKLTEHEAADILKYQVVTMERLEEWGACNPDACRAFVGDGIAITGANIMAAHAAKILNPDWFAARVLKASALAEYERLTASSHAEQAWAEYKRAKAEAWVEHGRVECFTVVEFQAFAKYKRLESQYWDEYERVATLVLAEIVDMAA